LALKTSDLSTRVDSKLAVLVRLERSRLSDVLRSRSTFSPDFASVASESMTGAMKLKTRVGLLEIMDSVLGRLAKIIDVCSSPTQIDSINKRLEQATVLLNKAEPTDTDVLAAQSAIAEASAMVDVLNQKDANFSQDMAARLGMLKSDIDAITGMGTYNRVLPMIAGQLQALNSFIITNA